MYLTFLKISDLRKYSGSADHISALDKFLIQLCDQDKFEETNWKDLWKNNRFQYIIRSSIDDERIIGRLFEMGCKDRVPSYIPIDIAQKIDKLRDDKIELELPDVITSFDQFSELIHKMRKRKHIPDKFRKMLANSIEVYGNLNQRLDQLKILELFKYESISKVFPEAIELNTIIKTVEILDDLKVNIEKGNKIIDVNDFRLSFRRDSSRTEDLNEPNIDNNNIKILNIHENLQKVYGEIIKIITASKFNYLFPIIIRPNIPDENVDQTVIKIMPYIIQKLKMWGCNAMTADNVSSLIGCDEYSNVSLKGIPCTEIRTKFKNKFKKFNQNKAKSLPKAPKTSISRIDTLVGIMNSVDSIVAQDILCIIAKFPMALPLIIKDLKDENSFKVCYV
jgi:hypothetical protein